MSRGLVEILHRVSRVVLFFGPFFFVLLTSTTPFAAGQCPLLPLTTTRLVFHLPNHRLPSHHRPRIARSSALPPRRDQPLEASRLRCETGRR